MVARTSHTYNRYRILQYLDELSNGIDISASVYVPSGLSAKEIDDLLKFVPDPNEVKSNIIPEIEQLDHGGVLFYSDYEQYLIIPPFPMHDRVVFHGFMIEPLNKFLQQEFTIAVVLVRLGAYAVGVFKGEALLSSKVGTGHIHSRHRKGGSSQRRFERGREKQMEYFFDRVCARTREHVEPFLNGLDFVVYGGERQTLLNFRKDCKFLQNIDHRVLKRTLDVRYPKHNALVHAIEDVWSSTVITWHRE